MHLLKEAIFSEEEEDLIIDLFSAFVNTRSEMLKSINEEIIESFQKSEQYKVFSSLPNLKEKMDNIMEDVIKEKTQEANKEIEKAISIVSKIHLHKNCRIND